MREEGICKEEEIILDRGRQAGRCQESSRISIVEPQQNETTAQQETLTLAQLKK